MRRASIALAALLAALSLSACAGTTPPVQQTEDVELIVFAAASLTEALDEIGAAYQETVPGVRLVPSYASSGALQDQIEAGANCDLFLSAASKQMDALEAQDLILSGTRVDLLENEVVLTVPEGDPAGIVGFADLMERLGRGDVFLAVGGDGVPVGQYTRKIFDWFGVDEDAVSSCLTFGSDVKEVTAQVKEGVVDAGIVYATDAASAGLPVVDSATEEMCGRVVYPAAVTAGSVHPDEARAFLTYLCGDEASAVFERIGFTPLRPSPADD